MCLSKAQDILVEDAYKRIKINKSYYSNKLEYIYPEYKISPKTFSILKNWGFVDSYQKIEKKWEVVWNIKKLDNWFNPLVKAELIKIHHFWGSRAKSRLNEIGYVKHVVKDSGSKINYLYLVQLSGEYYWLKSRYLMFYNTNDEIMTEWEVLDLLNSL